MPPEIEEDFLTIKQKKRQEKQQEKEEKLAKKIIKNNAKFQKNMGEKEHDEHLTPE